MADPRIAIVDYGMGNLRSVEKGFKHVGVDARVVNTGRELDDADAVVLPGVGAFADCMTNLGGLGLVDAIRANIQKGKPFLGICLGLQVLFAESEEFGNTHGLGIFEGRVPRFRHNGLKVPHMGWNSISKQLDSPLLRDVPDASYVYFVHSYYVDPADRSIIAATTEYGVEFTSMVWKDNVIACQFHPEKSQAVGLTILKAFGRFAAKN